jgi:hypothetical protein
VLRNYDEQIKKALTPYFDEPAFYQSTDPELFSRLYFDIIGVTKGDALQYRFERNTKITKAGPSLSTHNSAYVEINSIYRQKFVVYKYETTEDITGLFY